MLRNLLLVSLISISFPGLAQDKTILVLADSLSASYGIALEQGWVSLLQQRLNEQGYPYNVFNASISGDTTHGANSRLDEILSERDPDITILELGGNDGLRGLPLNEIQSNLDKIIMQLDEEGSDILLVPMLLPPNYGKFYIDRFTAIYSALSDKHDLILGRFILEGIAENPELMQDDGIHPKAEAQEMMLDNIWIDLESMLDIIE